MHRTRRRVPPAPRALTGGADPTQPIRPSTLPQANPPPAPTFATTPIPLVLQPRRLFPGGNGGGAAAELLGDEETDGNLGDAEDLREAEAPCGSDGIMCGGSGILQGGDTMPSGASDADPTFTAAYSPSGSSLLAAAYRSPLRGAAFGRPADAWGGDGGASSMAEPPSPVRWAPRSPDHRWAPGSPDRSAPRSPGDYDGPDGVYGGGSGGAYGGGSGGAGCALAAARLCAIEGVRMVK